MENATPASWKVCQKNLEEYERDRVGKYTPFFQGNVILPIPEISEALDLCIISLIVMDIKTRRFVGLKKDTFEELMCPTSCHFWDSTLRLYLLAVSRQGRLPGHPGHTILPG